MMRVVLLTATMCTQCHKVAEMLKKENVEFTEYNIVEYMKDHRGRWADAVASMRLEGLSVKADNPTVPILIVREGRDIAVIPSEFIDDHTIERIAGCRQC